MRKQLCVMACGRDRTDSGRPADSPPAPATTSSAGQNSAPPASATNLGSDANGSPLRRALKTGHVSNYDESKVAPFTLPDPLVFANGKPVRDRSTWILQRRPRSWRCTRPRSMADCRPRRPQ